MTKNNYKPLIILLFYLITPVLHASDLAKEKRWADQIVDALITGDAEWLPVGNLKVLAIYTPSEIEPARGATIILHGIGVHPDWPDVIHPLRTRLPEAGWATLSLQMPILPNEASDIDYLPLLPEVAPRIDAAIDFLQAQGDRKERRDHRPQSRYRHDLLLPQQATNFRGTSICRDKHV